jgi:mRNA-degrading endonuclease RelE of RelBE toxin-antitoxin system
MIVLTTPRFDRALKKISPHEKKAIDQVIWEIIGNPQKGEMKKGDLTGTRVYKFKFNNQQMLLAYSVSLDTTKMVLMGYGVHENFYRDLKR